MFATRVPFDSTLPFVVACESLPCAGKRIARGAQFAWRELGITEDTLRALYIANQVDCVPEMTRDADPGERRATKLDDGRIIVMTAGERVSVETPKQKRQRQTRTAQE